MKSMNTILQNRAGGTAFNGSEDNALLRCEKSELGFVWMLWVCWRGVVDWKTEQWKHLVFYMSSEVLDYFYESFFFQSAHSSATMHCGAGGWWEHCPYRLVAHTMIILAQVRFFDTTHTFTRMIHKTRPHLVHPLNFHQPSPSIVSSMRAHQP